MFTNLWHDLSYHVTSMMHKMTYNGLFCIEKLQERPKIFIVLSICALHDILDMSHILFSLKLALCYKGFTKYYREDTLHYILLVCMFAMFSRDLAIQSFGMVIVYYYFRKSSSILLLNYQKAFQIVKHLHINLPVDRFKSINPKKIGFLDQASGTLWFCSLRSWPLYYLGISASLRNPCSEYITGLEKYYFWVSFDVRDDHGEIKRLLSHHRGRLTLH